MDREPIWENEDKDIDYDKDNRAHILWGEP